MYDYVVIFPRNLSNVSFFACRTCICMYIYSFVCVRAFVCPIMWACVRARLRFHVLRIDFDCWTRCCPFLRSFLATKIFCLIFYVDWPNTVELLNWRDDNYLLFISCIIFFVRLFVFQPAPRPLKLLFCMHSTMEMIISILLILNKLWIGQNMSVGRWNM